MPSNPNKDFHLAANTMDSLIKGIGDEGWKKSSVILALIKKHPVSINDVHKLLDLFMDEGSIYEKDEVIFRVE